ncbi:MSHA biogenesis protein MshP [Photobacterium sp. R1]
MSYSRRNSPRRQQGSALVVAIFVIVVMAAIAAAMLRVSGSSQDMTTREVLSTRAWLTAHSANEVIMNRLFPVAGSGSSLTVCDSLNPATGAPYRFAPSGNGGCGATVTCESSTNESVNTYYLVSEASCGSGPHTVTRTQVLWAKDLAHE